MVSAVGKVMLAVELRAGAQLFRYPQISGGVKWALTGARMVPVALDEICEEMAAEGLIEPHLNSEYRLWQRSVT